MLSLTVFMNIVSELMPITSDAVPLIGGDTQVFGKFIWDPYSGTYFNFIMGMVASSVLLTVLVLNYHHRHPDTHNMPTWVSQSYLIIVLSSTPWAFYCLKVLNFTHWQMIVKTIYDFYCYHAAIRIFERHRNIAIIGLRILLSSLKDSIMRNERRLCHEPQTLFVRLDIWGPRFLL